jgi:hypothetical protein
MVQVTKCIEKDTGRKKVTETERVKDLAGAEGDVCGIVLGGGEGVFGVTFRTPIGLLYFLGLGLCPKDSDPQIRRGPLEKPFPYMYMATSRP